MALPAVSVLGARDLSGDYTVSVDGRPVEAVRFYEAEKRDYLLVVRTQPITEGYRFDRAGTLRGLTLRDIKLPPSDGGMGVWLEAHDEAHPIEGVRFENVTDYGPVVRRGKVDFAAE